MSKNTGTIRSKKYDIFLEELRRVPNIRRACREAGIATSTIYKKMDHDPAFKAEFEDAITKSIDDLEHRAFTTSEVDATMMRWLLKHHKKEVYGDTQQISIEMPNSSAEDLHNGIDNL